MRSSCILLVLVGFAISQGGLAQTAQNENGIHPEETYDGARENINLATGNLNLSIPLLKLPGRNGFDYSLSMGYNSQLWYWYTCTNCGPGSWAISPNVWNNPDPTSVQLKPGGWYVLLPGQSNVGCLENWTLTFGDGSSYSFPSLYVACAYMLPGGQPGNPDTAADVLTATDSRGEGIQIDMNACKVTMLDGHWYHVPNCQTYPGSSSDTFEDTNGNQINWRGDTLGRTIPSGTGSFQYSDSNGVARTVSINYSPATISCSLPLPAGATQQSGPYSLPSSIVLPNGLTYILQYDGCLGLSKIVYPSGGYTRYVYDSAHYSHQVNNPVVPQTGTYSVVELVAKYVCRAAGVTPGATSTGTGNTCPVAEDMTTYTPTINGATDTNNESVSVVDPLGNKTVYQFTQSTQQNVPPPVETSRTVYQGTSTVLRTINTAYPAPLGNNGNIAVLPLLPISETTILPNGLQTQTQWDRYGYDIAEQREYGYGQGAPGAVVRKTDYTYGCDHRKTSEIVYDGSGNQIAKTTYELDNYTAGLTASGAVQHDSAYGTGFTARCNVTAIQRWRNTDGATLTTRMQYDDAGNVLSTTDPLSHTTTTSYADVWGNSTCTPSGGNAAAYPTQVTDPAGLITKHSYNSCTGTVASATDPNNQVATASYDLMDRATQSNMPDGGQTSTCFSEVSGGSCYSNAYPLKIVGTQKITSSLNKISTTVLDGIARVSQTQLNSDPDGVTYVDTTYDAAEHKATVSNPYRAGDTTYVTTYQYDGMDRVTKVIPPDGSGSVNNVSTAYDIVLGTANCTSVTDQAGKARKSCSDALGRLTQVFEDPSGLNYETDYQYDLLNNLLRVDQKGTAPTDSTQWRTRTFAYNSLSQLLCAANPEIALVTCPNPDNGSYTAGTVRYAYDNDGNLLTKTSPKPNQTSSSVTVQTTYSYDLDNRLVKKTYNDGLTPTVQFAYDNGTLTGCPNDSPPGQTDLYPKGRRTSMCDASGGTTWIHDTMGRTQSERRSISGVHGDYDTDTFNLDGSIASLTALGYGIGYTYNGAGRAITVKNFADPNNYVTAATYAPFGGLATATMGAKPITVSDSYNKRLQPATLSASTTSATIMSLTYNFGLGTNDNGNVVGITNNRDGNRTQNFMYDSLNRIQQAYTTGANWGETMSPTATAPGVAPTTSGIDAWGNLSNRSGVTGKTLYEPLSAVADKQNRLTGFGYDAAGNMTSNGSASYTYDAENRLIMTAGVSYLYDGDGKRVEKCTAGTTAGTCATNPTGTLYWTGTGSDPLVETDLAGNTLENYIFFNGQRIARRDGSTKAVHYYFSDHLGTHSLITDANGTMPPQSESDYYPYGGEIPVSGGDTNHFKFTGKERDSESGLDFFGARHDSSSLGRFMSPDSLSTIDLSHPQKLNRYTYATNEPLGNVDAGGRCTAPAVAKGQVGICAETYIRTAFIPGVIAHLLLGRGDNRGPNAHGGTFRTQTLLRVDPSTHDVSIVGQPAAGKSCAIFGCKQGINHSELSKTSHDDKGNTYFTLTVYGENGYEAQGIRGAPGGWIEMQLSFQVNAKGEVTVSSAETKGYPSASVFSYDTQGKASDVWEQTESGNIDDLQGPAKPAANGLTPIGGTAGDAGNPSANMDEAEQDDCIAGDSAACGHY
jgi:RHS repeat-associated protein